MHIGTPRRHDPALPTFIPITIAASVVAFALSLYLWPDTPIDGRMLLFFLLAAIPLFHYPYRISGEERVALDELLLVLMLPLLPGSAVAAVFAVGILTSGFLHGRQLTKILFNAAVKILAVTLAVTIVHALGFADASLPTRVLLSVLGALVFALVNTVLVTRALTLVTRSPFGPNLLRITRGVSGYWSIATAYGVLAMVATHTLPWLLPVVALVAALAIMNSYRALRDRDEHRQSSVLLRVSRRLNEAGTREEAEAHFTRMVQGALGVSKVHLQRHAPEPGVAAVRLENQALWLVLPGHSSDRLSSGDRHFLSVLVSVADSALGRLDLLRTLERQSLVDPLTGANNRRSFEATIERLIADGLPFSLALFDIDHFKSVNDRFGHDGGNRILMSLTQRVKASFRDGDVLCRIGGDEFALLLPGLYPAQAEDRIERLRADLKEVSVMHTQEILLPGISISVGVAGFPQHGRDMKSLVGAADRVLYEAKRGGRDRIITLRSS